MADTSGSASDAGQGTVSPAPTPRRGRLRRWRLVLAVVAAAGAMAVLLPPVQARGKAAVVLGEALDRPLPRPLAAEVVRERTSVGGVAGDLYAPEREAPAVLLVPGATREGLDDRRAIAVARAYARAGRAVFVPDLQLYRERFDESDLERIVAATTALAARPGADGRAIIVGFSYGGAFALVAAADPRLEGILTHVGVFGAYYDLVGVVQAVTTGVSLVDGRRVPWEPHPAAEAILRARAVDLAPADQRDALAAALAGDGDPSALPPAARALHALLTNEDPQRTFALARQLPPDVRARLARFSPATVAKRVRVPVIAMHSTDDPAVPYGEALRLEAGLDTVRLWTVELFQHVDFRPDDAAETLAIARDLWRTWSFATHLLAPQERPFSFLARGPTARAPSPVSPAA